MACSSDKDEPNDLPKMVHDKAELINYGTPVKLNYNKTEILLEDYFMDVSRIDSVFVADGMAFELSPDKKKLTIENKGFAEPLSELNIYIEGLPYSILMVTSNKRTAQITLKDNGYKKVQIKGEMNAWNPATAIMQKNGDTWMYDFSLSPGRYQYLFVVDGKDMLDPANETKVSNGSGGMNSLLELQKPDPKRLPGLFTKEQKSNSVIIGYKNRPTEIFTFWENYRVPSRFLANAQIEVDIPPEAKDKKRSHIRIYSYNEVGVGNDLMIPLENGKPLSTTKTITRADKEAQIMYFTLVDRFHNGNEKNDDPVVDKRVQPQANYQGGDLAGITKKIKDGYFKKLNINAIWLSPITQNPLEAFQEYPEPKRYYTGYHGYWPVSSSKVDHRFGTEAEMKGMVDAAHGNDINILLDYVCNHVHIQHPIYKNNPDAVTRLDLPGGRKNIRIWEEQRLTTWFDTFIPSLDLSDPKMIDLQTDSTMYWIKKYNLDGFRHDATKHIPEAFWRTLTRKLKEEVMIPQNKSLYQIGETYGSRDLIASYIGTGMLDSQFDFNIYFDSRDVFLNEDRSFEKLANSLDETFTYYGFHHTMGNMTGNHDQPRFISYAGGDLKFGENDREAGWNRKVGVGDPSGYSKLSSMTALMMTLPGVPVIFYGDEIGMPGANDPDNRRMMRFEGWSDLERATFDKAVKMTSIRRNSLPLIYGDFEILHIDKDVMAFARPYFDQLAVVAFNKGKTDASIVCQLPERFSKTQLKTNFDGRVNKEGQKLTIDIPKYGFEILTQ